MSSWGPVPVPRLFATVIALFSAARSFFYRCGTVSSEQRTAQTQDAEDEQILHHRSVVPNELTALT